MDMKRFFLYAIAIAALALAGCGGGGGGTTVMMPDATTAERAGNVLERDPHGCDDDAGANGLYPWLDGALRM